MNNKLFYAKSRKEWREWLKKNHFKEKEIWLVYYKKHTGKASVDYLESVEEAICFGWIDGIVKRIDDEKYTHRFTVRRANSRWSPKNIRLAEKMIKEKKMTRFGMNFFEQRRESDKRMIQEFTSGEITLPAEIKKQLTNNEKVWRNFLNLAPGYKKQYIGWILSAKKEETIKKRVKEVINHLKQNSKLGMK